MEKIKDGYYMKARKVEQSAVAHMPPCTREVWDYLLAKANHSDKKYSGFIVKRGQLFRTYSDIQETLHWMVGWRKMTYNENHMKKAMKNLRDALMVTTEKKLGGVLITVLNYDFYQDPRNYEGTKERTIERTIEEPLKNHPLPSNNKNEKNVKNEEELKEYIYDQNFDKFWIAYPRKIGKKKAHSIWKRMTLEERLKSIGVLPDHIQSEKWIDEKGKFIPHPATWLGQGRWEDEIKAVYKPPTLERLNCDYCKAFKGRGHEPWCQLANSKK